MSPEEKRRGALEELDDLISHNVPIEEAIVRAAENNAMKSADLGTVAQQVHGDLEEHVRKLHLRALNEAIAVEVKLASSKRRPGNLFDDCYDPEEVAIAVEHRIGRALSEDEFPKIHEARRDYVHRQVRELGERLG